MIITYIYYLQQNYLLVGSRTTATSRNKGGNRKCSV